MRIAVFWSVLFFIISPFCATAQVVINEISVCNVSEHLDPDYDYSGWVELYNTSDSDIEIRDLYFSDDDKEVQKYRLVSNRTLPAHGFQIVWLNGELLNSETNCDPDIDVNDGGYLSVANASGVILDVMEYAPQYTHVSYGHRVDGDVNSELVYFVESSFKASNNGVATADAPTALPIFSKETGFYSGSINVEISCATPSAEIYYTLDGSPPDKTKTLYTESIVVNENKVIRARAYKTGFLKGQIASATYLINEREPNLPIFFLVVAPEDLYDDMKGIYTVGINGTTIASNTGNYNQRWNRLGHLTFMDEEKDVQLKQGFGVAISGNASRVLPQKSLKIKAKTKYGESGLKYPFFADRSGMRYKRLTLRNGGQDWKPSPLIHDMVMQRTMDVTGIPCQAGTPVVVYLNGVYWGIYNLREAHNDEMIESRFGWNSDDIDRLKWVWNVKVDKGNRLFWDEMANYVESNDLSTEQAYAKINEYIDLDNMLTYMAMQYYIFNKDWGDNNQEMFRRRREGYRWRWSVNDLDNGLQTSYFQNLLQNHINRNTDKLSVKLLPLLLANDKIKNKYIHKMCLMAGAVFNKNRFSNIIHEARLKLENEFAYHTTKWEDQVHHTLEEGEALNIKYNNKAHDYAYQYLQELFGLNTAYELTISTDESMTSLPLTFNEERLWIFPYEGKWFADRPLHLTTPLYFNGKKFQHWSVTVGGSTSILEDRMLQLNLTQATEVTPVYENAALVRRAGIYINELSPDNDTYVDQSNDKEDWLELYNASSYPIDVSGMFLSLDQDELDAFELSPDAPMMIAPYSYLIIWCSKETDRGVNHANFKLSKKGKTVFLSQRNANSGQLEVVDRVEYPATDEDHSFGRYPDGSENLVTFNNVTFDAANIASLLDEPGYVENYELVDKVEQVHTNSSLKAWMQDDLLYVCNKLATTVMVYDACGKMLRIIHLTAGDSISDLSIYAKGAYLIRIEDGKQSVVLKWIKSN
jgi:hypothetical protein